MAFSSPTLSPIPSSASSIDRTIASKPSAYSLLSRTTPRNNFRAVYAFNFSKICSVSRVFGDRFAILSGISMKYRSLFHSRASKKKAGLNSDIADARMAAASAITVVLAVANRVLYKLALVPMKRYPFFLAQFTTFGYVAVYFSILYVRLSTGIVTKEMLEAPKSRFMAIGLLEAIGVACGMSAGAMLPGPAIPILSQTFLVWQLVFSVVMLGRKYSLNQLLGCLLVSAGVILAVASGSSDGKFLSGTELLWPALMVTSSAFHAAASIIKEFVFIDSGKHLQGKSLDIFVVNSFGSAFQALFIFFMLPFLSNLKGIPINELPEYLYNGAACFLNIGGSIEGCEGAPFLPLLFIMTNVAFNISLLSIVKMSSALLSSLVATLAVPLSIYILSLPLPYIPEGTDLNSSFVVGTSILVLGLVLYNIPIGNQLHKSD